MLDTFTWENLRDAVDSMYSLSQKYILHLSVEELLDLAKLQRSEARAVRELCNVLLDKFDESLTKAESDEIYEYKSRSADMKILANSVEELAASLEVYLRFQQSWG